MGGQSLGGIMRSSPSMSSSKVMSLSEGAAVTLIKRAGAMDGYAGSRSAFAATPDTSGAASCALKPDPRNIPAVRAVTAGLSDASSRPD